MDTHSNPFNPGAGESPPELAGRSEVLEQAVTALERTKRGRHAKSLMIFASALEIWRFMLTCRQRGPSARP